MRVCGPREEKGNLPTQKIQEATQGLTQKQSVSFLVTVVGGTEGVSWRVMKRGKNSC